MEEKFAATQMMGFILTLTIMHSFILAEPSPDEHVVNRGGAPAALDFAVSSPQRADYLNSFAQTTASAASGFLIQSAHHGRQLATMGDNGR